VDDLIINPLDEIDLNVANYRAVNCTAIIEEYDGEDIININSAFFDSMYSGFFEIEDKSCLSIYL
jgi:hypothetical protein